ncbi:type III secretion protein U [Natronocella acetinitrilica]|uniref:Type III secretion protein U n=1 Tax=Natronocella acetinitrilica TaxID=414046 RepID=A0AAE3KC42_9GAMM|nr:EscU/YscU/HrcU family type III secretion system export apparatus switch protein [Natronocella acetinitrilica]MCP1675319.1 type III secretion protein U [Natronocella acetinitrilica]
MSEDKSQKTEKPTPHKLRKAREQGQVPKSKEIVSAASLIITLGVTLALAGWMAQQVLALAGALVDNIDAPLDETLGDALQLTWRTVITACLPVIVTALAVGIVANVAQFGVIFSAEPIKPKLQKINPVEGAKKIFSRRKLLETLKAILKIIVIALVAVLVVRDHLQDLLYINHCGLECAYGVAGTIVVKVIGAVIPLFIILAAIDYAFQRAEFMREQRMSKQEVKREFKDTQGNPEVKQERKSRQREQIEGDVRQSMIDATVVVTDGRALLAIKFDEKDTPVPMVTVRESGKRAMQAKQVAERHERPIIEDAETTALLMRECKRGAPVPRKAFDAVAGLIVQARRMQQQG